MKKQLLALACWALTMASAHADVFKMDFTFNGFENYYDSSAPPEINLSGSLTYEAQTMFSGVTAIDQINLTIDGHTYALSETGFLAGENFIGALQYGVQGIALTADDFALIFNDSANGPQAELDYTSASSSGVYIANAFVTIAKVPEPDTLPLLLLGALGLGAAVRRSKR